MRNPGITQSREGRSKNEVRTGSSNSVFFYCHRSTQRGQRGWLRRPWCRRVPYRHVNTGFRSEYRMTKEIAAFGLRSLSKLLTLSALVKPEKNLFFLERIDTKKHKKDPFLVILRLFGCARNDKTSFIIGSNFF
jgi:hypothetical protein